MGIPGKPHYQLYYQYSIHSNILHKMLMNCNRSILLWMNKQYSQYYLLLIHNQMNKINIHLHLDKFNSISLMKYISCKCKLLSSNNQEDMINISMNYYKSYIQGLYNDNNFQKQNQNNILWNKKNICLKKNKQYNSMDKFYIKSQTDKNQSSIKDKLNLNYKINKVICNHYMYY